MWAKKEALAASQLNIWNLSVNLPFLDNAEKGYGCLGCSDAGGQKMGRNKIQTITYKGSQFWPYDHPTKTTCRVELKTSQKSWRAQKRFLKQKKRIETIQEARKLAGFTLETKLLSETEIRPQRHDFQKFWMSKGISTRIFKNIGLENLLKNEPNQYIADRAEQ